MEQVWYCFKIVIRTVEVPVPDTPSLCRVTALRVEFLSISMALFTLTQDVRWFEVVKPIKHFIYKYIILGSQTCMEEGRENTKKNKHHQFSTRLRDGRSVLTCWQLNSSFLCMHRISVWRVAMTSARNPKIRTTLLHYHLHGDAAQLANLQAFLLSSSSEKKTACWIVPSPEMILLFDETPKEWITYFLTGNHCAAKNY